MQATERAPHCLFSWRVGEPEERVQFRFAKFVALRRRTTPAAHSSGQYGGTQRPLLKSCYSIVLCTVHTSLGSCRQIDAVALRSTSPRQWWSKHIGGSTWLGYSSRVFFVDSFALGPEIMCHKTDWLQLHPKDVTRGKLQRFHHCL